MRSASSKPVTPIAGRRITVAGLGHFGGQIALARWLVEREARTVLVTDREPADKLRDALAQLADLPIEYRLGEHREDDFRSADLVVASPAIPIDNPFLKAARAAGVPVTTEIRLFVERCPAKRVIGVTATKGKSTTTAMLGEILKTRYRTWVGGNIGRSLLPELNAIAPDDVVVLELSSYMLEHLRADEWSPNVAVVGLVSVDHVEWHGAKDKYVDAKRNIVRFQRPDDIAVLNAEDETARSFAASTAARVVTYGIFDATKLFELALPGRHNQLNAQAAFAAAAALGVTWDQAQRAMRDFPGLPHRLQLVHTSHGGTVRWFNDSIATVPEAALAALDSFPTKSVIQIVGGSSKGLPFDLMCEQLRRRAKAVICIGATGGDVFEAMSKLDVLDAAEPHRCEDLAAAVPLAHALAAPGDAVLLSPGFASYDQFTNFQERGDVFTRLVRATNG